MRRRLCGECDDQLGHPADDLVRRPTARETAQLEADQRRDGQRRRRVGVGDTECAQDRHGRVATVIDTLVEFLRP